MWLGNNLLVPVYGQEPILLVWVKLIVVVLCVCLLTLYHPHQLAYSYNYSAGTLIPVQSTCSTLIEVRDCAKDA